MARIAPQTIPFSIDWLPDGRLLVVDGPRQQLLREDSAGQLESIADFSGLSAGPFNELVATAEGTVYVRRLGKHRQRPLGRHRLRSHIS